MHQLKQKSGNRAVSLVIAAALTVGACGNAVESPTEEHWATASMAVTGVRPLGVVARIDPSAQRPFSAPAGAHLSYYGGRVVSNVQVVQVLYGSGTYASFVSSTASPSLATFYAGVTSSPYIDWLTEYNTPASGGTNQRIGRGSFVAQFQITPSDANNGSTISDANIQAELVAQINAGNLPAPTADAAGNNNTLYMINFPNGKIIAALGEASCGNSFPSFCAYHGTIAAASGPGGKEIYYGVLPDMEAGSGCDVGCGLGAPFDNQTSTASHELVETITDAEIGVAPVVGAPLAWYDSNNGEIGDICNQQQASIVGGDGVIYTVQKEFSNAANDCIVGPSVSTFKVTASPLSKTGEDCEGSASLEFRLTATLTSGTAADAIGFAVTGLPDGSVSFSPSTVSSNGGTTTAIFTMPPGSTSSVPFTVTATGGWSSASDGASTSTRYPRNTCLHPPCRCQPGLQYCGGSCIPAGFCCKATDPEITIGFSQ